MCFPFSVGATSGLPVTGAGAAGTSSWGSMLRGGDSFTTKTAVHVEVILEVAHPTLLTLRQSPGMVGAGAEELFGGSLLSE